jgi:hypothetical protein
MTQSSMDPERVPDVAAQDLLARAAELDADGATLDQLRQAAMEAGISESAFDAAVAEWRAVPRVAPEAGVRASWLDRGGRNALAFAASWVTLGGFAAAERLFAAPWLVHKLSDPIALTLGAVLALRLRARTATLLLGGLAVSQGAEFLMDAFSGEPAVHGSGAHFALMTAGVLGFAAAQWLRRRPSREQPNSVADDASIAPSSEPSDSPVSRSVSQTKGAAAGRFRWPTPLAT